MESSSAGAGAASSAAAPRSMEGMLRDVEAPMRGGDLVILYMSHDNVDHLYLTPDNFSIYNSKFGDFHHADFVGKPFGSKIEARSRSCGDGDGRRGYLIALAPTPELWAMALPHRTQIVQPLDAAVVCLHLELKPGKVVVESGTGSGAMTSCLARAVAPTGRVRTIEFNATRAAKAQVEFPRNGLHPPLVECAHGDVCEAGFGDLDGEADAAFLDVPEPWRAVDHVLRACRPGAKLCSYSPCVEQVARTCAALRAAGCDRIRTLEVREKEFAVKPAALGRLLPRRAEADDDDRTEPDAKRPRVGGDDGSDAAPYPLPAYLAKPLPEMRGHTAFLTFCSLPPPEPPSRP